MKNARYTNLKRGKNQSMHPSYINKYPKGRRNWKPEIDRKQNPTKTQTPMPQTKPDKKHNANRNRRGIDEQAGREKKKKKKKKKTFWTSQTTTKRETNP